MNSISACIITRNEEALLPDCLASIRSWVTEICVLDTGSQDATIAIAEAHGAKVATFKWGDDFAAARNASLDMASGDWIFVIDADERLRAETGPSLLRAVETPDRIAYFIVREDLRSQGPPHELAIVRLFRNRPDIRYRRPVHEDVMDDLIALGAGTPEDSGVRIEHVGYLPEILKHRDKHARNLDILRRRFTEAPEDLYNAYKLAVTLPVSAVDEKLDILAAAQRLVSAMSAPALAQLPFLPRLFSAHAAALAFKGALGEAIGMADRGLSLSPESSELKYRRGELARCAGDLTTARNWLERARENPQRSVIAADRPDAIVALCWISLLAIAAENPGLVDLPLEQAPTDPRVYTGMVRLLFIQGHLSEAVAQFAPLLESHLHLDEVRLLGGEIAWRNRDFDTARSMWELADPSSHSGHIATAWRALEATRRGSFNEATLDPPRDVSVAALIELFCRQRGKKTVLDPIFKPDAVARAISRWQLELKHAGHTDSISV
jgi:tetratricopeptide (TPR) repeat protein